MTDIKRMRIETTIAAPVARVCAVMLEPETYEQWTSAFFAGSRYEGSWEQGGRIHFLAPSGDGMVAEIAEHRPGEFLSIRHLGVVAGGVEDTTSPEVRAWAPAYENYTFSAVPGGTRLTIDQDVTADHEESMRKSWTRALVLLKELCEGEAAT